MQQIFYSHGCSYKVEYFHSDNADMVRFYATKNELYSKRKVQKIKEVLKNEDDE